MALAVNRAGVILEKCDMSYHRPGSVKRCAAGTCQHTWRLLSTRGSRRSAREQTARKSLSAATSRIRSAGSTKSAPPASGSGAVTERRVPITRRPAARDSRATSWPMPPRPMTPIVAPRRVSIS